MHNQNFAKFTERARKVLSLAQEEAQRFQHNYIGTEHLLLALLREGQGIAANVLGKQLGLTIEQLRRTTESFVGRGDRIVLGEIGLTKGAKLTIEAAVDEAQKLNHPYIGTEHLLLGLTRVPVAENEAGRILQHLGISLETLYNATIKLLSGVPPHTDSPAPSSSPTHNRYGYTPHAEAMPRLKRHPNPPKIGNTVESFTQNSTFSPELIQILRYSQEEAERFQHNYIGTEHLLLGLLHNTEGNATKVLNNLGVELNKVRSSVEFIIGRGDHIVLADMEAIGLTPRAKKVLQLAADAAYTFKSDIIEPEHLLLGLVYEGEGIAAGVLDSLGVTSNKVQAEMLRVLGQE